jgi:hypothetical protein
MENMNQYKKRLGKSWIRSSDGTLWICPAGALDGNESPSREQLSRLCVDESFNPENA